MKASPESLLEMLEGYEDKLYIGVILLIVAIQVIVSIFPSILILPEGWQSVAIFLILVLLLNKTVKISGELKTKTSTAEMSKKIDDIDKKMDNERSGSLLKPGTAWETGGDLINKLVDGDIILACNLVSWNSNHVTDYINANKEALKKGVKIKRLYADNKKNQDLAKLQSKWVKNTIWEGNFERKMYEAGNPMLDYILATDSGKKPKWAILWIYTPEEMEPTLLYGFHIIDDKSLEKMKKDFDGKWDDNELTTVA